MPQMMPLNWLFLSPVMIILMIVMISSIYFSYSPNPALAAAKIINKKYNIKFLW